MSSELNDLVDLIRCRVANAPLARPKLRLVAREDLTREPIGMDAQTRDLHYRCIRDLARMYWLGWLVRRETQRVGGAMESLSDDDLIALRQKMEKARECRIEGIGFDDAGIISEGEVWT